VKRIIAALAVVAAVAWPAAVFTGAGVAHADDYIYSPLAFSVEVAKGAGATPPPPPGFPNNMVLWTSILVHPGDIRRVTDQLAISMPGDHHEGSEVDMWIECFDQFQNPISTPDPTGSGTNYTSTDNAAFQWNASMLLIAPKPLPANAQQAVFTCGIFVGAVDSQTTVLPPTPGQTNGTWLEYSSLADPGNWQYWWAPPPPKANPNCNPKLRPVCCPTADKWLDGIENVTIATTENAGASNCVYLGGPNQVSLPIFQATWQASNDATVVDFAATGSNTVCYQYTGSCREIDDGPRGEDSQIRSWLEIRQLDQNNGPCGDPTVVYSTDTADGTADTVETLKVSGYQHHSPVYYHATVPVSQLCGGSRLFATSLVTELVGGDPIKFENKNLNMINLEREPTTPVPDVTGLSEEKATKAIVLSGLTVFSPTLCTPGPAASYGVVATQNSPGGIVEPVGSPVQLTLYCGLLHP
jgi:hypothetical protein